MSGPRDPLRVRSRRRDEARGLDAVPRRRGDRQEGHRVCRQPGQGQVETVRDGELCSKFYSGKFVNDGILIVSPA